MSELVSIIIVNWNGKHWLEKCLASIFIQSYQDIEIIVVDNGSKDDSVEFVRNDFPKVKILENGRNLGFAAGNNVGAKEAQGSMLLLLNNDAILEVDTLQKLVAKLLSDTTIGICQPKIRLLEDNHRLDSVGSFPTKTGFFRHYGLGEVDQGQYDHFEEVFSPKGACILIRKDVFDGVGGFDSDFFCYFEETDLAWRIWLYGYRVILLPEARVYHRMGATSEKLDFSFVQYHSNKNRLNAFIKNLGFQNLLWFLPIHLCLYALLIIFSFFLLQFKKIGALLKALGWNILNLPSTLKKRRFVQTQIRKISDKKIFLSKMVAIPWKAYFRGIAWFLSAKSVREKV